MEPLIIAEGQSTPKVHFDKKNNKFEITGNSLPEDVLGFYAPVFSWVEQYATQPNKKTEINIKLSYFNSSSSKAILDILGLFEEIRTTKNLEVDVLWHYLDLDEDMLSTGKEFESMLNIPFQFITFYQD